MERRASVGLTRRGRSACVSTPLCSHWLVAFNSPNQSIFSLLPLSLSLFFTPTHSPLSLSSLPSLSLLPTHYPHTHTLSLLLSLSRASHESLAVRFTFGAAPVRRRERPSSRFGCLNLIRCSIRISSSDRISLAYPSPFPR